MNDSAGQRAFQNARLKKKQKAETARLLERAIALVNTGSLPDARALLRQLLELSPRHFDALYLLGMTEYHTRRYQEAELLLAQAIDAEPQAVRNRIADTVSPDEFARPDRAGGWIIPLGGERRIIGST